MNTLLFITSLGLLGCQGSQETSPQLVPRQGEPSSPGEGTAPYVGHATPNGGGSPLRTGPDGRVQTVTGGQLDAPWRCDQPGDGAHSLIRDACFVGFDGATFRMGAQRDDPTAPNYDDQAMPHEGPVREVSVEAFWLQRQEVSAALYRACLDAGWCRAEEVQETGAFVGLAMDPSKPWPANAVSWDGAVRLCDWLGGRLPTEAEWALAARGVEGRRFPWGDRAACGVKALPSDLTAAALDDVSCIQNAPVPVNSSRLRTPEGLVGLGGNVWEWVSDAYASTDGQVTQRVQRGGGWMSESVWEIRAASRAGMPPDQKFVDVGFRCAWSGGAQ